MAERRMFSKSIIDSDAFLDMPQSSQLLYFHLSMRADDDGFINKPKSIMRIIGCKDDDMKLLITKKYIIPFENGVVVIKHWRIHNYIRKDTYTETNYKEEKAKLCFDDNNVYALKKCDEINAVNEPLRVRDGSVDAGKVRIGKVRIGKDKEKESIKERKTDSVPKSDERKHRYGEYGKVLLRDSELEKLKSEYTNADELIAFLDEYIEMKGYKARSHYLCIKKWVVSAVEERKNKGKSSKDSAEKDGWVELATLMEGKNGNSDKDI